MNIFEKLHNPEDECAAGAPLLLQVCDGWGPLCDILKLPLTEEFLHSHKPEGVKMVGGASVVAGLMAWGLIFSGARRCIWYAWRLSSKFCRCDKTSFVVSFVLPPGFNDSGASWRRSGAMAELENGRA
jgi:hypothetical protein